MVNEVLKHDKLVDIGLLKDLRTVEDRKCTKNLKIEETLLDTGLFYHVKIWKFGSSKWKCRCLNVHEIECYAMLTREGLKIWKFQSIKVKDSKGVQELRYLKIERIVTFKKGRGHSNHFSRQAFLNLSMSFKYFQILSKKTFPCVVSFLSSASKKLA